MGRALDRAFPWIFAAYVAISAGMLLLALVPALVHQTAPPLFNSPPRDAADQVRLILGHAARHTESVSGVASDYALSLLNLATGLLLFMRRPRDPVARLLAIGMVGTAVAFNYQAHVLAVGEAEVYNIARGLLPILPMLNILHIAYHSVSGVAYAHAFLMFPNGVLRPLWLRWLVVGIYLVLLEEIVRPMIDVIDRQPFGGMIFKTLTTMFRTSQGSGFEFTAIVTAEATFFIAFFGALIPVAAMFSLRARRSLLTPLQRAQSDIVVVALSVALAIGLAFMLVGVIALGFPGGPLRTKEVEVLHDLALKVFPPLYTVVPLSVVVAILRYRLFDIDRLINRTLVYGALSATLLAMYVLLVLALSALLRPLTGSSDLAVAGSTLAVVAAFGPLRARIQRAVDRRFYRSRYDAARAVDAFGARLRSEVDLDSVRADLIDVVYDTVSPAHASVWLREARR